MALRDLDLEILSGEFVVLLGASGCGKTTLLRCIAGLEVPDSGTITIRDTVAYSSSQRVAIPPEQRRIGMVFQSYALWPHMTVFQNLAYPLNNRRLSKQDIGERVRAALRMIGLESRANAYPGQLSGGQQQRISLARATVGGSELILFDEPLSNIDTQLRERLRLDLLAMHLELGFAAIYVTHDQFEAMAVADRIVLIDQGRVLQHGSPEQIYNDPHSPTAATFTGATNRLVGVVVEASTEKCVVQTPIGLVVGTPKDPGSRLAPGNDVVALFRPDALRIDDPSALTGINRWNCDLEQVVFLGSQRMWVVKTAQDGLWLSGRGAVPPPVPVGSPIVVTIEPDHVYVFPDPSHGANDE